MGWHVTNVFMFVQRDNHFLFNPCCSNPSRHSVNIDYLHKSQSKARVGFIISYGCLLPHGEGHERPREKYKLALREEREEGIKDWSRNAKSKWLRLDETEGKG